MPLPIITTVPQHTQEQWLFKDEELNATPSILQGMPVAEERSRRAKGVNFITQAGILLKLPQVTLGTASMFFHRLFMRIGMDEKYGGIHHYNIAATALFLATKSEENCRKTTDIVIAVAKIAGKNPLLIVDQQSKEFWKWKDNILAYEELMLELLTFDVVLDSPYTHLYHLLRTLEVEERKELRNVAWAFVNDSQLTTLGLMLPAKDIAVAAIFFAARFTEGEIEDTDEDQPWWKRVDGNEQKIIKAVTVLHDFYTNNPLKKIDAHEGEPPRSPEDLNSTRRRRALSVNGSSEKRHVDMDSPSDGKSHKKEPSDESKTSEESRTTRGNATQRESTHKKESSDENGWGEPKTNAGDNTNPRGIESTHQKEKSNESKISQESQTAFGNATHPHESTHKKEPSNENAWGKTPTRNTEAQSGKTRVEEMSRKDGEVRGDSDVKLKEAANDPATHQERKRPANEEAARSLDGSVANGVGEMHIAQAPSELRGGAERLVPPDNGISEGNLTVKRKAEEDLEMEEKEASETKRPRTSEQGDGEREEGELE